MNCPKCGNPIQPNEAFCSVCGAAVEQTPAEKKNPLDAILANKKLLIIIAGAVLATILLIVVLAGVFSTQSSAEKVAKAFVIAEEREDIEAQVDLMPEFYLEYVAEEVYEMKKYDEEKLIRKIKKATDIDEPDDEVEIKIVEVEVKETYGSGDDKVKAKDRVRSFLKSCDNYDVMEDVSDCAFVTVGYEVDDEEEEATILCAKISGKWYALG